MKLTTELLEPFIGGDLEVQNRGEDYLFRGRISEAVMDGEEIKVSFEWLAQNDGGPRSPTSTWTKSERTEYVANLTIYGVNTIGEGRIAMRSSITGELVVLFPKGGSALDEARVSGL